MAPTESMSEANTDLYGRIPKVKNGIVYMVTIKCNHYKYTSIKELLEVYHWVVKKKSNCDWHTGYAIELDKLQRLHIHGVFISEKKVNPASYRKKGWSVHFQVFDTYENAIKYINKQNQCIDLQQQREIESYSAFHNMFIQAKPGGRA